MKKIVAFILFILMLFTLLILPAAAETETEQETYTETPAQDPRIPAISSGQERDFTRLMENNNFEFDWIVILVDPFNPYFVEHPKNIDDYLSADNYPGVGITQIEEVFNEDETFNVYRYFRLYLEDQTEEGVIEALKAINSDGGIMYAEPHYEDPQIFGIILRYLMDGGAAVSNTNTDDTLSAPADTDDIPETAAPAETSAPAETEAPAAQPPAPQPAVAPPTADRFAVTTAVLAAAVIACLCVGAAVLKKKGAK